MTVTQSKINDILETRTDQNRNDIKDLEKKHTEDIRIIHSKIDTVNNNISETRIEVTKELSETRIEVIKELSELKQLFSKKQKIPLKFWISIILAIAAAITLIVSSIRGEKPDHDLIRKVSGIDTSPVTSTQ